MRRRIASRRPASARNWRTAAIRSARGAKRAIAGDASVAEFELELGRERERDVEPVGRQEAGRAVRPFEQHHRAFRQVVEAELGELGMRPTAG